MNGDTTLATLAIACGLVGLLLVILALARLRRRRVMAAGMHGTLGLALLAAGVALAAVGLNLHTYARLTYERPVAELRLRALGPQDFEATLRYPDGSGQAFELRGDEWQLDARILKWNNLANLVGLDTQYRLERLSGRYSRVEEEVAAPRTVYALAANPGLDLWNLARRYDRWLRWVDATQGSAAYLPMADQAHFRITITQSGLLARPLNDAARTALADWN